MEDPGLSILSEGIHMNFRQVSTLTASLVSTVFLITTAVSALDDNDAFTTSGPGGSDLFWSVDLATGQQTLIGPISGANFKLLCSLYQILSPVRSLT